MVVMTKHSFARHNEDDLIVIPCKIDGDKMTLALDTGASHTTVDLTPLLLAGYSVADAIGKEQIETASGIIEAYIFVVKQIECLGIIRKNFKLSAYDFFAYHYLADFEGVLGLDFLKGTKFCIDIDDQEITIQMKK
jgi:predicted aspartyl protease